VEFEHVFQQSGFISALQVMMLGVVMAAGVAGKNEQYCGFVEKATIGMVTFGPMAMLIYVLYSVSRFS